MTLYKAITILFFASVIFYSCGQDDIVTNNSNTPVNSEVIFQKDSVSAWIQSGGSPSGNSFDYTIQDTAALSNVKLSFRAQSNLDSLCTGEMSCQLMTSDSTYIIYSSNPVSSIDSSIVFNFNLQGKSSRAYRFNILILSNLSSSSRFIRFKDIKLEKIN